MSGLAEIRRLAERFAEEAGEITLRHFGRGIAVEEKADMSPVTVADRAAEQFIRDRVAASFPDDAIHGEEFAPTPGTSGRRWIIDPIDGTKSFIRGVPLYGTMIGIEEDGEFVAGAMRFPATRQTISAHRGGGCTLDGKPCRVSGTNRLADAFFTTTSLEHWVEELGAESIARVVGATKLQRTWGDCYGYLLLASGHVDIMMDPVLNLHDFAALIPIVEEAGGRVTALDGTPPPGGGGLVASNGLLHDEILAVLRG